MSGEMLGTKVETTHNKNHLRAPYALDVLGIQFC